MLKDITLGQFFPGDTVVHRLDPRTKLILVIVYIAALFTAVDWFSYGLMFAVTAACVGVSRIKLGTILRGSSRSSSSSSSPASSTSSTRKRARSSRTGGYSR